MTTQQLITDAMAALGAIGAISTILAHLSFMPAAWAERFARLASFTSQTFSVNRRDTQAPPPTKPVPYIPERSKMVPSDPPPNQAAIVSLLLACLCLTSCLQSKFTWPDAVACAPAPATLETQVEAILMAGGDYDAALEQLALADSKQAVICAVSGFLDGLSASDEGLQAPRSRARAFLEHAGTKVSK